MELLLSVAAHSQPSDLRIPMTKNSDHGGRKHGYYVGQAIASDPHCLPGTYASLGGSTILLCEGRGSYLSHFGLSW